MILTIASGKGGTGKTTIATSLALSLSGTYPDSSPVFLDCDVEAPNAHFFLEPAFEETQDVINLIPRVDDNLCNYCGVCGDVCQYHAITVLPNKVLVFPQLCHGCGLCASQCPEHAITETSVRIGVLEKGIARDNILFARGLMEIGETMASPIIRQLKKWLIGKHGSCVIIDAPPGASCPVVEAIKGSDYVLLVTEPTRFGLHDLKAAFQLTKELQIPAGVIINRDNDAFPEMDAYCKSHGIPILMRIPFEREIAAGISRGIPLTDIHPEYIGKLIELYSKIEMLIGHHHETTRHS